MDALKLHTSKIRSPFGNDKVYKDECIYSFDTPECETGLFICMNTFCGFGKRHVERHHRKTGNAVFLHHRRIKKELPPPDEEVPKKKPTRMAIGVAGGFDLDENNFEIEEKNSIVVLPEWAEIALDDPDLPGEAQISAAAILAADSAARQEELAAMASTWDGESRVVSKYAENLEQVDNGRKIPPSGWKCDKCDLNSNLWLNLSDGAILCGRRFWDGSGGNNHAVDHYDETKFPLAVKLGTITPDGADVHSYAEDELVLDPKLPEHLAHFGIDIMKLEKTDKTMAELEIDLNQKVGEWDVIQESGCVLTPVHGPGFTGIHNLGNSCYMNSVMQVLFTLPDFKLKYFDPAESVFDSASGDLTSNFNVQMCKFGHGLLSGEYSKPQKDETPQVSTIPKVIYQDRIRPQMFKTLVGKNHPEFSTKKQQDAQEFLLHIISLIERNSRSSQNPTDCLKFRVEERIECTESHKVSYVNRDEFILALPIPMEAVTNKAAVQEWQARKQQLQQDKQAINPQDIVRPIIPLSACLEAFSAPEFIENFFSNAVEHNVTAKKSTRLATFPDYMIVQMKKFTLGEDWVPKKLDVSLEMPDELDVSFLRGSGIQPGEEELPSASSAQQTPEVEIDTGLVKQVVEMGFPFEACRKAVYHTQNAGLEPAINWVMEHMNDPDFSEPLVLTSKAGSKQDTFVVDEDSVAMIQGMGFSREQALKAMKATDNNVERAIDWIFSHAAEQEQPMETDTAAGDSTAAASSCRDGQGKYRLIGFISHMGTSTMVGHYVCHIRRPQDGRWVIFNDEKVHLSEKPPKDLGYLYFYQRLE